MSLEPLHPDVVAFLEDSPKEMIVNGEKRPALSGQTYTSYNPSDGSAASTSSAPPWATWAKAGRKMLMRPSARPARPSANGRLWLPASESG